MLSTPFRAAALRRLLFVPTRASRPSGIASLARSSAPPSSAWRRCGSAAVALPAREALRLFSSSAPGDATEKTDEEKAALKAERDARKEAKKAAAAAKKAEKAAKAEAKRLADEAENVPLAPVAHFAAGDEPSQRVGDLETVMSRGESGRNFVAAAQLGAPAPAGVPAGERVWLRARVQNVRAKGSSVFLVLRQGAFTTVQACLFKDKENPRESKQMIQVGRWSTVVSAFT